MKRQILSSFFFLLFSLFSQTFYGQISFEECAESRGILHSYVSPDHMGGGATFFDMDNDGDEDIWICGGSRREALFENDGNGNFREIGIPAGLAATNLHTSTAVLTADFNNDGWQDVCVLGHRNHPPLLFENLGNKSFRQLTLAQASVGRPRQSHAAALADVNRDGLLDIYIANYIDSAVLLRNEEREIIGFEHSCFANELYINRGGFEFEERAESYGLADRGCALATSFSDIDQDGDADLIVVNDFGEWVEPNAVYLNNYPDASFSLLAVESGMDLGMYGMGVAIGDYDQDEDLDYYFTNIGQNYFMQNQGAVNFQNMAFENGSDDSYMDRLLSSGWGSAFLDIDNDTDLDLFVSNGEVPSASFILNAPNNKNRLFLNQGGENFDFEEVGHQLGVDDGGKGRGFAYADIDNDGDLDLLQVRLNFHLDGNPKETVLLYENESISSNNWFKVRLVGTSSNKDAIGSRIRIVLAEKSWIHEYGGGTGSYASQHSKVAHFGLGNAERVDSLIIQWPSGKESIFTELEVNQFLQVLEDGSMTEVEPTQDIINEFRFVAYPVPTSSQLSIRLFLLRERSLRINLYDLLGRKVANIASGVYPKGANEIEWAAPSGIPAGHYLLRYEDESRMLSQKIILNH
ncbi:MAG: FG-GAP-like repeat-containing protein [Bacteroidota bacterium]